MNLLQFMDKHIFFSFLTILLLLVTIDSMWANWCRMHAVKKRKEIEK
jgi:hypothetical protein